MNIHDQDIYFKAKNEGISQGEYQAKVETAKNFVAKKISIDIIAECTGVPVEEIKKLM